MTSFGIGYLGCRGESCFNNGQCNALFAAAKRRQNRATTCKIAPLGFMYFYDLYLVGFVSIGSQGLRLKCIQLAYVIVFID